MESWIALLRGVNVGGHRKLPMAEFRALLGGLGFEAVATYIQSGNAVFRAAQSADELAATITAAISTEFGFETDVLIIPVQAMRRALAENPFQSAEAEPGTLHLYFSAGNLGALDFPAMQTMARAGEEFALRDNIFYLHTPNGFGRSELAGKLSRFIKVPVTARNLRSCRKILELAEKEAGA